MTVVFRYMSRYTLQQCKGYSRESIKDSWPLLKPLQVGPTNLLDTLVQRSEDLEQRGRHVEITVVASRAFVLDGRDGVLAVG